MSRKHVWNPFLKEMVLQVGPLGGEQAGGQSPPERGQTQRDAVRAPSVGLEAGRLPTANLGGLGLGFWAPGL